MAEAASDVRSRLPFGHLGPVGPDKDFILGLIGYFRSLADVH